MLCVTIFPISPSLQLYPRDFSGSAVYLPNSARAEPVSEFDEVFTFTASPSIMLSFHPLLNRLPSVRVPFGQHEYR